MSSPQASGPSRSRRFQRRHASQVKIDFETAVSKHDTENQELRKIWPDRETFNCAEYARGSGIPDHTIRNWLHARRERERDRPGSTVEEVESERPVGNDDTDIGTISQSQQEESREDDRRSTKGNKRKHRAKYPDRGGPKRQVTQYSADDLNAFESAVRAHDRSGIMTQRGRVKEFNCAEYARESGIPQRTCRGWLKELREGMKTESGTEITGVDGETQIGFQRSDASDSCVEDEGSVNLPDFDFDFMSGSNDDHDYTGMDNLLSTSAGLFDYDSGMSSQDQQVSYASNEVYTDMDLSFPTPTNEIMEGYIPDYGDGSYTPNPLASEEVGQVSWGDPDVWYRLGEEAADGIAPSYGD